MIKLYFAPRTRSSRPRWMLEELEVPYDMVRLDLAAKDHKKPEYLKIHPHGLVPALADGDTVLFESAGICMYLADKFPEKKMAPPLDSPERALYCQWLAYAMTSVEPAAFTYFLHTVRLPEERRDPREVSESKEKMAACLEVLSNAIGKREFLVGNHLTAVDVIMASLLNWVSALKMLEQAPANISTYLENLRSRPAFRRSLQV